MHVTVIIHGPARRVRARSDRRSRKHVCRISFREDRRESVVMIPVAARKAAECWSITTPVRRDEDLSTGRCLDLP